MHLLRCSPTMAVPLNSFNQRERKRAVHRRHLLATVLFPFWKLDTVGAYELPPARVDLNLAPDRSKYDITDASLRKAAQQIQDALNAKDVVSEERIWTEIIDQYSNVDAPWVPDVIGRAWGNRGNARARQGKMEQAIEDLNKAMEICPWSMDPVLNRGVVLESLGQFEDAVRDYRELLKVDPYDPAVWNNLGNAMAGLGDWSKAIEYYGKASALAPKFSFALANKSVAMYQTGDKEGAKRVMRNLLRKYPDFTDMRAALTAVLWEEGREGEAESEWERVQDPRYSDIKWLQKERRWPPKLVDGLMAFLKLKSVP